VLTGERVEGNTPTESAHLSSQMSAWEGRVTGWGGRIFRDRPSPGPDDVVLISNDNPALARHPELITAQVNALSSSGNGMMMSGVFVPKGDAQHEFEADMATFLQAPAVVLCQSGWDANVGLINTLPAATPTGSTVYLDMLAHASLWTGASGGGGTIRPFVHNNMDHLERLIVEHGSGLCRHPL
jgi:CAI-1 autoinducer synthase